MKFRPCIDIHNGKVKQIVGGSLLDQGDQAVENFAADQEADYFANTIILSGEPPTYLVLEITLNRRLVVFDFILFDIYFNFYDLFVVFICNRE